MSQPIKKYLVFDYSGDMFLSDDEEDVNNPDNNVCRFDVVDGVLEIERFNGEHWIAVDPKQ